MSALRFERGCGGAYMPIGARKVALCFSAARRRLRRRLIQSSV